MSPDTYILPARRRCWLLSIMAAVLCVGTQAAPALAAPTDSEIRECVANNLPRYSVPDRAVAVQYIDLEDACRLALSDDGDQSGLSLTPLGGPNAPGTGPGGSGTNPGSAEGPRSSSPGGGAAATEPTGANPTAAGGASDGSASRSDSRGPQSDQSAPNPSEPTTSVESATIRAAAVPVPTSLGALPGWVSVLFGLLVAAVTTGIVLQIVRARAAAQTKGPS